MQSKCIKSCTYSKAMNQVYPRKCQVCGHPESQKGFSEKQTEALVIIKKYFLQGANIRNKEGAILINTYKLVDDDLDFFQTLKDKYQTIEVKRSGTGLVAILTF